jgi:CheY-like chemotaxis protein
VDDEKVIALTLGWIFKARGYESRVASSAEEAISMLDGWVPDLALLDIWLPGMNGIDFAIHLKGCYPDCRVLLISGKPESLELMQRARRGGHRLEVLPKPVAPAMLLDRAAELLATAAA